MKIGLCLSGQRRFINNALESQLISITRKLKSNDQLIIHSGLWSETEEDLHEIEDEMRKCIKIARKYSEASISLRKVELVDDIQPLDDNLLAEESQFRHSYSMYYSMLISIMRCKSHHHKIRSGYDLVIKSRTDLGFHGIIDLHDLYQKVDVDNEIVSQIIPEALNPQKRKLVNDQFIVGGMRSMSIIASIYFHLINGNALCRSSTCSEELLAKYCNMMKIKVMRMNGITTIQRDEYSAKHPKGNHIFHQINKRTEN